MRPISALLRVALACSVVPSSVAIANTTDNPAATAESAPPVSNKDETRKICRNLAVTGSRLSKRYCRTQAQWDADAEATQRQFQQGQGNGGRRYGEEGATPR